ncbi:T-complex 10 C-terminal domain-containing protein [Hymenobacter cellulosilyticus]|uniref:T-complex 10 C-terminal domain-containing protein n=1 Tax=Hymenobacter cellulosilyticus TaxID=2932248 RepID=A0A8T9Q9P5_9BACT|nr:T-complex 10 C-terminal domain-containing protein [Hymenobacter cellulosilyticus]UOQ72848.1 T-complex 10 C-terminal domain-containing protein [Hymenobacter cellulosilyticus]
MKNTLLLLSCVAALSLCTSCNPDKAAAVDAAQTPSADTAVVVNNDVLYQEDGNRVADMVTTDLGITDTAQVRQVRRVYYTRAQRMGELKSRYISDTTGQYVAMRQLDTDTDNEIKTVFNDDNRYNTYQSNRPRYYGYDDAGTVTTSTETTTTTETAARPARRTPRGSRIVEYDRDKNGETKIKYANGKTVKIDADGDTKVEYPNGTKVKRDSDDGKVKIK